MTDQPTTPPEPTTSRSRIVIEFDGMNMTMNLEGGVTAAQMFAASGVLDGEAAYMMDAHRAQRMASQIETVRALPPRKGN